MALVTEVKMKGEEDLVMVREVAGAIDNLLEEVASTPRFKDSTSPGVLWLLSVRRRQRRTGWWR